jgi:hypothetical protein
MFDKPDLLLRNSFDGFRIFCFGLLCAEREFREDIGVGDII